jgi:hypothetical protein
MLDFIAKLYFFNSTAKLNLPNASEHFGTFNSAGIESRGCEYIDSPQNLLPQG